MKDLSRVQLTTMLELQMQVNNTVDPNWLYKDWDFYRCIMMEAAEAVDHHGWKHWKKHSMNLPQLQMELVDIWHFLLANMLKRSRGNTTLACSDIEASSITDGLTTVVRLDRMLVTLADATLLEKLDLMCGLAAAKRFSFTLFERILSDAGMTSADLYSKYIAKNVLNIFRQDHGYKEGTYMKGWWGIEDNEWLMGILKSTDTSADDLYSELYDALEHTYARAIADNKADAEA